MALNVNAYGSDYVQLIKGVKDRSKGHRIIDHAARSRDSGEQSSNKSEVQSLPHSVISAFSSRMDLYEAYDTAKKQHSTFKSGHFDRLKTDFKTISQISAYENVSKLEGNEKIRNMLSISVYA